MGRLLQVNLEVQKELMYIIQLYNSARVVVLKQAVSGTESPGHNQCH